MEIRTAIEQAMNARRACEEKIFSYISEAIADFERQTGLRVVKVDVPMIDLTNVSDEHRRLLVGKVKIELDL